MFSPNGASLVVVVYQWYLCPMGRLLSYDLMALYKYVYYYYMQICHITAAFQFSASCIFMQCTCIKLS